MFHKQGRFTNINNNEIGDSEWFISLMNLLLPHPSHHRITAIVIGKQNTVTVTGLAQFT